MAGGLMRADQSRMTEPEQVAGLRTALSSHDLRSRRQALAQRLVTGKDPETRLQLAYLDYMAYDFDSALDNAKLAFRGFRQAGLRRRAAVAAAAACRASELAGPSMPALVAEAAFARARAAEAANDNDQAVADYQVSLQALGEVEAPLIRAALHLGLARVLADTDPPGAVREAQSALVLYEQLGAPEAEMCVTLLKRLGISASYHAVPTTSPLADLSRREREVIRLVGEGLSNPEIAKKLFISPKTVEHHVSSILSKLGMRSRLEVVRGLDPALR